MAELQVVQALILAANLVEAEKRRLEVDAAAFDRGCCMECEENARRYTEYSQALGAIREMIANGAAV